MKNRIYNLPSTIFVGGRFYKVNTLWSQQAAIEDIAISSAKSKLDVISLGLGEPLDDFAAHHATELFEALIEWHNEAYKCMEYGTGKTKGSKETSRLFDADIDHALIVCDFQKLYGIDLSTWKGHWYQYIMLLSGAMRDQSSLLSSAISARLPIPRKAQPQERERLKALKEAWALPPTQDELIERLKHEF